MAIPPVIPFPALPYPLPQGFQIDKSHVLMPPEDEQCCASCVSCWLDCITTQAVRRESCDWVINVNYKVFYIKWRDVAPRPPWTRQVWDIFQVLPGKCPGDPSTMRGLGWQWCWADVIKTLKHEIFSRWVNQFEGPGGIVVADGTNAFQPATVGFAQIGPVLRLDAADDSTITETGGLVSEWRDKSTKNNHARQLNLGNQPQRVAGVQNNLPVLRFTAGSTWMDIRLKAQVDSHLFVVGRFNQNPLWPRGTFFSATGLEDPFGGIEGKVYQDTLAQPAGTPFVYLNPQDIPMIGTSGAAGIFAIWEYSQTVSSMGEITMGVNAFDKTVYSGNTSGDFWDPTQQTFGQAIPIPAAIGRSNWGVNPAQEYDYLDGDIGEILLYPRRLAEGERTQVLNVLRAKWALGAPLPFPPSP